MCGGGVEGGRIGVETLMIVCRVQTQLFLLMFFLGISHRCAQMMSSLRSR